MRNIVLSLILLVLNLRLECLAQNTATTGTVNKDNSCGTVTVTIYPSGYTTNFAGSVIYISSGTSSPLTGGSYVSLEMSSSFSSGDGGSSSSRSSPSPNIASSTSSETNLAAVASSSLESSASVTSSSSSYDAATVPSTPTTSSASISSAAVTTPASVTTLSTDVATSLPLSPFTASTSGTIGIVSSSAVTTSISSYSVAPSPLESTRSTSSTYSDLENTSTFSDLTISNTGTSNSSPTSTTRQLATSSNLSIASSEPSPSSSSSKTSNGLTSTITPSASQAMASTTSTLIVVTSSIFTNPSVSPASPMQSSMTITSFSASSISQANDITSSSTSSISNSYTSVTGQANVGVTLTPSFPSTRSSSSSPMSSDILSMLTTTTVDSSALSNTASSSVSNSYSSQPGQAFVGVTMSPSMPPKVSSISSTDAPETTPSSEERSSGPVFTCPDDDGTYYADQAGNGYQVQCDAGTEARKRHVGITHGFAANRVPISPSHQPDFATCVNSCRQIAGCVGTSYVATTGDCTFISVFTGTAADVGVSLAFPADLECPSFDGYSFLDSSGAEYGVLCNTSYPSSSNLTSVSGFTSIASCSNVCSDAPSCVGSSFSSGICTVVSDLNSSGGIKPSGAHMILLLQRRRVEAVTSSGTTYLTTTFSTVQDLPTAVNDIQKGINPFAIVVGTDISDIAGCGDAFWQTRCSTIEATTGTFSTVYTSSLTVTTLIGFSTKSTRAAKCAITLGPLQLPCL